MKAQHKALGLVGFLAAALGTGALASWMVRGEIAGWYADLVQPKIAPPNAVFGPVWTVLYILMAVAVWLVWQTHKTARHPWARRTGMWFWWAQLVLNFGWTLIFFRAHAMGWALVEICVLWAMIALTLSDFWRVQRLASALMVPYLLWVTFAGVLNFEFWRLNVW